MNPAYDVEKLHPVERLTIALGTTCRGQGNQRVSVGRVASTFFDEQEEQSRVKTEIVVKYFKPWATIMLKQVSTVGYVDFYCGPGRFEDGAESTPLLLLREIVRNSQFRRAVRTSFSDRSRTFVDRLNREVAELPDVRTLTNAPGISVQELDEDYGTKFDAMQGIPTLSFIDPWGYKGLTRTLLASVIRGYGCEAIFFFNYSRINAAIQNNTVEPHIEAIFGKERLARLRHAVEHLSTAQREPVIMRELGESIEELGAPYMIPFRFRRPSGGVHYICFVSKSIRGYTIMKEVMAGLGVKDSDGVPKFEYMPTGSQIAFEIERPLLALPTSLLNQFAGRTISVTDLVDRHSPGTPFIKPNYKTVLLAMEDEGRISCAPSVRRRGTLADHVRVSFPSP